jgi:hypothetical protein
MPQETDEATTRRGFLKLLGGSAVLIPIAGLTGCSGDKAAPTAAQSPAAPAAAPAATPAAAPDAAGLVQLAEDEPAAVALGYRHDAAQVDAGKYPRWAAGQQCSNCIQYRGEAGESWGGCGLFPGKRVNAGGWCNGYAAKA